MASTEQLSDAVTHTAKKIRKEAKRVKRKLLRWIAAQLAAEGMDESKAAVEAALGSTGKGAAKAVGSLQETLQEAGGAATETVGALKEALEESGALQDALHELGSTIRALKEALPLREAGEAAAGAAKTVKDAVPLREAGEAVAGTVGTLKGVAPHRKEEEEKPEAEAKPAEKKAEKPEAEAKPAEKKAEKPEAEAKPAEKKAEKPEAKAKPAEKKAEKQEAKAKPAEKKAQKPMHDGGDGPAAPAPKKGDGAGGYLGMTTYPVPLSGELADEYGTKGGLMVLGIEPEGPADEAGLLPGDTLLTLDGDPVPSLDDLKERLAPDSVGRKLHAKVLRAGEPKEADLEVGSPP